MVNHVRLWPNLILGSFLVLLVVVIGPWTGRVDRLSAAGQSGWEIVTLDRATSGDSDLVINSQGLRRIVYNDELTGALLLASENPWSISGWSMQRVVVDELGATRVEIAIDENDGVHIVYISPARGNEVWLTHCGGGNCFSPQAVPESEGSQVVDMMLDANGRFHIVFQGNNTEMTYAILDGEEWTVDRLAVPAGLGPSLDVPSGSNFTVFNITLALDSQDHPHIALYSKSGTSEYLTYHYMDGDSWAESEYIREGHGFYTADIAVNEQDQPMILFHYLSNLILATRVQGQWIEKTVAENIDVYWGDLDLVLNAEGQPAVSYVSVLDPQGLTFAERSESGWSYQWVEAAQATGHGLALGPDGQANISYFVNDAQALRLATYALRDLKVNPPTVELSARVGATIIYEVIVTNTGSHMDTFTVSAASNWPLTTSAEIGPLLPEEKRTLLLEGAIPSTAKPGDRNEAIVTIQSKGNPAVQTIVTLSAAIDGGKWVTTTIDDDPDTGYAASLALDSRGFPHVSYYDGGQADLRYATQAKGGWAKETVDTGGDVGQITSLAVGSDDRPRIAYLDADNNYSLKIAEQKAQGWTITNIPYTDDSVALSLVVDDQLQPHLAYTARYALFYAFRAQNSWTTETVTYDDLGWTAPGLVSLALDGQSQAHISYNNVFMGGPLPYAGMEYKVRHESGWSDPEYPSGMDLTWSNNMALDEKGQPWISFINESLAAELVLAQRGLDGWINHVLPGKGAAGYGTSLAINGQHILLCYHNPALVCTTFRAGGWVLENVAEEQTSGNSAAVDAYGRAHVIYRDDETGKLLYSTRVRAGLELSPMQAEIFGSPGTTVTHTIQVANSGNLEDAYRVDLSGQWPAEARDIITGLRPGEMEELAVTIAIPAAASAGDADTITALITSSCDPEVKGQAQVRVVVIVDRNVVNLPVVLRP